MTDNQPLVSILIPLYNQERYFEKCIRSVCRQTYRNLEIIIVNDGSTDRSPQIARQWASKDSRIKVIDKQNEGTIFARRDGYRVSTGQFLTFVDSDDMLPVNAVDLLVNCMIEQDADIVMGAMTMMLGPLKWANDGYLTFPTNQLVKQPELFEKYYVGFFGKALFQINMCAKLFRKSVIDNALQETELFADDIRRMGEDHYFTMKLFPYAQSMYRIAETVYLYRAGGSVDYFNPHYPELFTLCEKRLELLDEKKYDKGYGPLYGEYVNMVYYHAQQLLQFKQGDKADVIKFFNDELTSRSFIPRLRDYFTQHPTSTHHVNLLIARDYEEMYNEAYRQMRQRCDSLSYRIKRMLMGLMKHLG